MEVLERSSYHQMIVCNSTVTVHNITVIQVLFLTCCVTTAVYSMFAVLICVFFITNMEQSKRMLRRITVKILDETV